MSETTASAKAMEEEKPASGKTVRTGTKKQDKSSFNMTELRELAELVNEHGFTEFEFENENIRVRLSKQAAAPIFQHAPVPTQAPSWTPPAAPTAETAKTSVEVPPPTGADLFKITSPIVGTFYRSPSPDKDPYVKEGSQVTPETVVCIVEAMKLMNEIQAETSGEVVEIYVENGQPVEYGQPLFGIRK